MGTIWPERPSVDLLEELGGSEGAAAVAAARDEDAPVREQRRRVARACRGHRAGRGEGPARGVVELGGSEGALLPSLPPAMRTRPFGSSVAVWTARAAVIEPVGVKVPLAGS